MSPAVYIQTNDATGNEVIGFSRTGDSALDRWAATSRVGAGRACRTWPRLVPSCSATMANQSTLNPMR
jgi:hypothetical protein